LFGGVVLVCSKCGKSDFERVYKTPQERIMNFWLPGKAYNCNGCGSHTYKHIFPYVSWQLLAILGLVIVIAIII